ncbi:hypothetical protein F3Y22_tig00110177pilonHSYRG00012 [Hibiscus syriacus]|uniref:Myb/SANT-like DNA-binding domain-containing protein n=1 Tax=Hibiscus syriacus TaxID=106335 RepID=A0A6A3BF95_HIBSY|nr:hypothetical protein F3Y22_tig00110177pilonHSYRG00012 [Hibiscus syriacus]
MLHQYNYDNKSGQSQSYGMRGLEARARSYDTLQLKSCCNNTAITAACMRSPEQMRGLYGYLSCHVHGPCKAPKQSSRRQNVGRRACMATYKVAGRAWRPTSLVAGIAWQPTRSLGVHGDLVGRWECLATYGWVVHVPCTRSFSCTRPSSEATSKLAELGYRRSAKKCKEKFENVNKYHNRTKDGRASKAKTYRFFDQLEAFQNNNFHSLRSLSTPKPHTPTPISDVPHTNNSIVPYGKKRKWKEFFKRLTKEVIDKQEELQNKFLVTIEKYEQKRMAREEAWRIHEMAGINKEHEILVPRQENSPPEPPPPPVKTMSVPLSLSPPPLQPPKQQPPPTEALNFNTGGNNNNYYNVVPVSLSPSPSRWPKAEIDILIKLRTNLNINSKRCKEKWENINKYYKKVKENNKMRPEDSKTCPYFHQLDALYKEKLSKPESTMVPQGPQLVRPEQQWPLQQEVVRQAAALMEEEADRENPDQAQDNEDDGDTADEYEGMISIGLKTGNSDQSDSGAVIRNQWG